MTKPRPAAADHKIIGPFTYQKPPKVDWIEHAQCATTTTPDAWFDRTEPPDGFMPWSTKADRTNRWHQLGPQPAAEHLCRGCPVTRDCLQFALDHRLDHGVWGGTTARTRRAMRGEETPDGDDD